MLIWHTYDFPDDQPEPDNLTDTQRLTAAILRLEVEVRRLRITIELANRTERPVGANRCGPDRG